LKWLWLYENNEILMEKLFLKLFLKKKLYLFKILTNSIQYLKKQF
jgi:hypothetical protein